MTRVKICGIRSLVDARVALHSGADLLGFVFYPPSHRCLSSAEAREIVAAVRSEFGHAWQAVGLFVNEPPEQVRAIAAECGFDLVQLSGDEDLAYCRALDLPFLKVTRPDQLPAEHVAELSRRDYWGAERVLLDAHVDGRYGGTGQSLDWPRLRLIAADCLLAGGLAPRNVAAAVAAARPWGVDVSSGVELGGFKDPTLIRHFLDEVRRADQRLDSPISA